MTPALRRELVRWVREAYQLAERRACRAVGAGRSSVRYRSRRPTRALLRERLREIAKEEDIPIVRDVSLARALFTMELEEEVPEELFDAVAEVLKWVETVLKAEGALPRWLQPRDGTEDDGAG